ncbi:hypothetical protein [Streptomyces sp. S.PB5]|uniref:hypothetical protein n=1 Tax=Streptomyces sp. S.PB5 TaxID=3020844 RepID=UPI0025B19349|nr:hypothetical protein [Streptomyces sp. S.PB5]MDN3024055.1 hypothetical protein [Streptomyces sp. S.PB5]
MAGLVLSDAEQELWDAFPVGRVVTGGTVRAEVVTRLLLGEREAVPGSVPALRLQGAVVSGVLDVSGCEVPYAMVMKDCSFGEAPVLESASTRRIDLSGSRFPALTLRDARIDGQLRLAGSRCEGSLGLTRAHVTGSLDLTGACLLGTPALHADSLLVERDVSCRDADIRGEMLMWSARVGGTFVLEGARVAHPGGATLNGDGMVVEGGLFCGAGLTPSGQGLCSQGELRLQDARISRACVFTGATLENRDGVALGAERLAVEGILALDGGFTAHGSVALAGATVQGPLRLSDAVFDAPGERALDGSLIGVGGDLEASPGFTSHGQVVLDDARVDGSVHLNGARLENPGRPTLTARRLQVRGGLHCRDLTSEGGIDLMDAGVGAGVQFHAARLTNPSGRALIIWGLTAGVVDLCAGFVARGRVSLSGCRITALILTGATIEGTLSVRRVTTGSIDTDTRTRLAGAVDLRHTRVDVLADDPACWPHALLMDGLVYENLEAALPVRTRLDWLAREASGYLPQPYEQLAATYTRHGHDDAARVVLLAKHRRHRASQTPALRLWGYVQDWTVGYGYRPLRAAAWLAMLVLVATVAFTVRQPPAVKPAEAPPFNSFLYGLDLLFPVVSFGQEGAFKPEDWQQWLAAALIAAGWILATTIAAGITRVLARR